MSTSPEVHEQVLCALIADEPQQCHRGPQRVRRRSCQSRHIEKHVRIDRRDATMGSPRLTLGQWIHTVIVMWRGGVDGPAPRSTG